jgi:RNA polymerase sigma factor (TIGR02999 family)
MAETADTTQMLMALGRGEREAADRLMPKVYDELRALAERFMQQERPSHTLQATAVVHEAYMRLIDQSRVDWKNRAHFFAVAAEMIRRVLVDYARRRGAAKRGGDARKVALTDGAGIDDASEHVDVLDLDDALQELERLNDRHRRVVELRFFGGLSVEETAHVLDVSPQTVRADWRMARAWLKHRLNRQS